MNLDPNWMALAAAGTAILALALVLLRGKSKRARRKAYPYAPAVAVRPAEAQIVQHLLAAFPECVVLVHAPLERLVTPRSPEQRAAGRAALAGMSVDFAVCAANGKAIFAFDLAESRGSDQEESDRIKNRTLKSAGIRLVRLKGTPEQWPEAADFRLKLAVAALHPGADAPLDAAAFAPRHQSQPAATEPESSIMGMTVLLLEPDEAEAAWRAARE